ncbi:MFS transporter [Chitinophaga sancti]|uniref:MFS transporter n=1 Tax=Chitinophaga sancti TaxID=1004 RepID=UPI003F798D7E
MQLRRARHATQLIFLVCGLGIASWAPMVPYAKDRLGLHEGHLGLLLLFLGFGALLIMPLTGIFINKYGSRIVITASALLMAFFLPLLVVVSSVYLMTVLLFLFGASVGFIDVAMNAQGVQVQKLYGRKIMSSLHGLFSVGGLAGSLGLGFLVKGGLSPLYAAISISILLIIIALFQHKHLLEKETEQTTESKVQARRYAWLRGSVIFLGIMCFSSFLSEGAMLDWSAVYLRDYKGMSAAFSGAGYAAFSVAMAVMRLLGDGLVEKFSSRVIVIGGSLIAAGGLLLAIFSPTVYLVLVGFILLGIGAANIVPVFFSDGGHLQTVPAAVAIPAISTMGYAGQLAGPALLGFIAHHVSLSAAFGCCAFLFLFIAIAYGAMMHRLR